MYENILKSPNISVQQSYRKLLPLQNVMVQHHLYFAYTLFISKAQMYFIDLILKATMEETQVVCWKVLQTTLWTSDLKNFSP